MITITDPDKMINPNGVSPSPQSIDSIELDVLYRGSMPSVGPMSSYNRLNIVGDDIILTMTHGDNTYPSQASESFNLDDLGKTNKKLEFAREDQQIVNYMKEYRKNFAGSLILEAGLSVHSSKKEREEIFYNPNNVKPCDFAYLKFDIGSWTGNTSKWDFFLSISSESLFSVPWNDREGMRVLIQKLSEPLDNLETQLALMNPSEALKRARVLSLFRQTEGYIFSEKERATLRAFLEDSKAHPSPIVDDMSIRTFDSSWTVDFKRTVDLASRTLAFDYSFFVEPGKPGGKYIAWIKKEVKALGGSFITILRKPTDSSGQSFSVPMDYVLGIIVKEEEFFNKNGKTFFDPSLGRFRLLYQDMMLGGRIPSIQEIEAYTGYRLS